MSMNQFFQIAAKNICLRNYFNCLFPMTNPFDGKEFLRQRTVVDIASQCLSSFLTCFSQKEKKRTFVTTSATKTVTTTNFLTSKLLPTSGTSTLATNLSVASNFFTDKHFWYLHFIALILGYLVLSFYCAKSMHRLIRYIRSRLNKSE